MNTAHIEKLLLKIDSNFSKMESILEDMFKELKKERVSETKSIPQCEFHSWQYLLNSTQCIICGTFCHCEMELAKNQEYDNIRFVECKYCKRCELG